MPETVDYAEACDYESLRRGVVGVLKRYFECDDAGNANKEYDSTFGAHDALDAIHQIVGAI